MSYACVDPAAIAGAPALDADLPLWGGLRQTYDTDFAQVSGVVGASCQQDGPFFILAIAVKPDDPVGKRTLAVLDRVSGYRPNWGLHALDINLAEGTLVDIVRRQSAAYGHH